MKVAKRLECGQLAAAFGMRGPPQTPDSPFVVPSSNWKTISEGRQPSQHPACIACVRTVEAVGRTVCARKRQQVDRTPNASRPRRLSALVVYPTVS